MIAIYFSMFTVGTLYLERFGVNKANIYEILSKCTGHGKNNTKFYGFAEKRYFPSCMILVQDANEDNLCIFKVIPSIFIRVQQLEAPSRFCNRCTTPPLRIHVNI